MTKIELTKKKFKFAFGLAVAAGATLASVVTTTAPAAAIVTVTVNGQQYNIEALPAGSFNSQAAALQGQPWWGDQPLAEQFAIQAEAANSSSGGLGFPNATRGFPYFGFDDSTLINIFYLSYYYPILGFPGEQEWLLFLPSRKFLTRQLRPLQFR